MKPPRAGARNASGLALSGVHSLWFWLSYSALLIASVGTVLLALYWRLPDFVGFYFFEALVALTLPLGTLLYCDNVTLKTYTTVWADLLHHGRATLLLNPAAVDLIRSETRLNPLLAWLRPPPTREVGGQLYVAALWYRAILAPEGAPWTRRYGEQLGWTTAFLLLFLAPAVWIALSPADDVSFRSAVFMTAPAGIVAIGMLGSQQLVLLARRQAILDYFKTHLSPSPDSAMG